MSDALTSRQIEQQMQLAPFPFGLLARHLEDLYLGFPVSPIFTFQSKLPEQYDPSQTPDGIPPHSRRAILLRRFLKLKTTRLCHMTIMDPEIGLMKRCDHRCNGFKELVKHHREVHNRICQYVCLIDSCMATFVKLGNALRHAERFHEHLTSRNLESRMRYNREILGYRTGTHARRAEKGTVMARQVHVLNEPPSNAVVEQNKKPGKTEIVGLALTRGSSVLKRKFAMPPELHVHSKIKKETTRDMYHNLVVHKSCTTIDVCEFHQRNIRSERFRCTRKNTEQAEWIAVLGMMDLCYGKGNTEYQFSVQGHVCHHEIPEKCQSGDQRCQNTQAILLS